jgi:4-hydroxybenzoate polyprenyltransferase
MELRGEEARQYLQQTVKAVLRHMGPEFWVVAIYPYYVSWVWASGKILPDSYDFVLGAVVIGPLLGGGALLFGDYNDRDEDLQNPRKLRLPFYNRPIMPKAFLYTSIVLFALSIILSSFLSLGFLTITSALVILSVLYSSWPVRLKTRGGLDLLANMLGFGVLCSFAGWIVVEPVSSYPWLWLLPMVFGTATLYLPTTIADAEIDAKLGVRTIAVKLGVDATRNLTILSLILANVAIIAMGLFDYLYTPGVALRLWPISVAEVLLLSYFLGSDETKGILKGIFSSAALMGFGTFLLMLNNVGIWNV